MFPLLHPYGHVAFQAQRGDVHTVLVNGRVVKHEGRLVGIDLARARRAVEETVEFAQRDARRRRLDERDAPRDPRARRSSRTPTSTRSGTRGSAQWKRWTRRNHAARHRGEHHRSRRGALGAPRTTRGSREIMAALVRHLHDFAREVELTEAEWMAAHRSG